VKSTESPPIVGLAYTWESGGVLAVLGFSSFPTEALALPT